MAEGRQRLNMVQQKRGGLKLGKKEAERNTAFLIFNCSPEETSRRGGERQTGMLQRIDEDFQKAGLKGYLAEGRNFKFKKKAWEVKSTFPWQKKPRRYKRR